jgi:plastocyanin
MSKSIVIGVIVLLVIVAGGAAFLAMHKDSTPDSTNTSTMKMSDTPSDSSATNTTPTATSTVSISNFAFSPTDITVKAGTTVTWTNNDSVAHTVTETDSQKGPDSGNLDPGKTFSFTYSTIAPSTPRWSAT